MLPTYRPLLKKLRCVGRNGDSSLRRFLVAQAAPPQSRSYLVAVLVVEPELLRAILTSRSQKGTLPRIVVYGLVQPTRQTD